MNQREAVIEAMRHNRGYATLGQLYRMALKVPGVKWGTRTPFKSINRVVQDKRYFYRIRPGLWALLEERGNLPADLGKAPKPESEHTYYQGLLVELGNLRGKMTHVPRQDRGKAFLGQPLGGLATVKDLFPFTYSEIVKRAATVDVIWFNERKFPDEFIEVEHTTDMQNSFLKFARFEDFRAKFRIVAPAPRKAEFESKLRQHVFSSVASRTVFTSYEVVAQMHRKANELAAVERLWSAP